MRSLRKETEIQTYIEEQGLDLTDKQLGLNSGVIRFAVEQDRICKACTGFDTCQAVARGQSLYLIPVKGDYLTTVFYKCAKAIAWESQSRVNLLINSSRMPPKLRNMTFANYIEKSKEKQVVLKAGEEGQSLFLTGNTGTGKTHLAAAIANKRIEEGREVVFVTVPELMGDIRKSLREGEESKLIDLVTNAELLVLDDLGTEKSTEWVLEQLFVIINNRYLYEKQTIVTSNYSLADLIEQMGGMAGQRIVSRLAEMCVVIDQGKRDRRLS